MTTRQDEARLAAFRAFLARKGFSGALVLTSDPHLCEYVPERWQLRAALSGFKGSAGTLLVLPNELALATDSRYWEQAQRELPSGAELIRRPASDLAACANWFSERLPAGSVVAVDEKTISYEDALLCEEAFAACGLKFLPTAFDWSGIWPERPKPVSSAIAEMRRPCVERGEKMRAVREKLAESGSIGLLLESLDDVAWVTNLRGADVPNNPVFEAELLVTQSRAMLYADAGRFPDALLEKLQREAIDVRPSAELERDLAKLAEQGRILVDPSTVTVDLLEAIGEERLSFTKPNPVAARKAEKTSEELEAIAEAHLLDAIALTEFYAELDERLSKGERLTEWNAAECLHAHRARMPGFLDESFPTIAAYGPNAAMPHYQPFAGRSSVLKPGNLLLIDSGAQYDCGTTDVTRMSAVGMPSEAMRRDVVLATRAMLRLLHLKFPVGTTGAQVDVAARMELWREGIDFGHGTGHGVGYVLNVHEGPVTISPRATRFAMAPGNVVSNEPGIYRPSEWGVRVENLMFVRKAESTAFGEFLAFEPLTLCPIDVRVLGRPFGELVEQLNAFNRRCVEALRNRVSPRALAWLEKAAAPL